MNVIFGISLDIETRMDVDMTNSYDTSFKVLDSFDYSSITTIDVKKNIYDLSVNKNGSYIALVENHSAYDSIQETFIKIYAVGARKTEEQEEVNNFFLNIFVFLLKNTFPKSFIIFFFLNRRKKTWNQKKNQEVTPVN